MHGTMLLYFKKGLLHSIHDLPANALLFRVLCNVLHTIIVIEKVQFWNDAFLAVVGIKIHTDYFHVHTCKHNTTKPNIDLFATNVCPLHLVKERVIYLEFCVTIAARYELSGWVNSPYGSTWCPSC